MSKPAPTSNNAAIVTSAGCPTAGEATKHPSSLSEHTALASERQSSKLGAKHEQPPAATDAVPGRSNADSSIVDNGSVETAEDQVVNRTETESSSGSGSDATTLFLRVPLTDSPVSQQVSPVLSRDFATEFHGRVVDGNGKPSGNDESEKIQQEENGRVPLPLSTAKSLGAADASGLSSATSAGTTAGNPRLRALKTTANPLGRSNSEPVRAHCVNTDLEKGIPPNNVRAGSEPNFGGVPKPITLAGLLEPERKLRPPPTYKTSLWNIAKYSWLNVLLVFIPVSFACHFADVNPTATFCVSFAAIIPLAALLGFATEELALRVGHTLGGLLNATLGNTVELIIAILALVKGELRVVQSSMIGSILSNCLLVLGCCFFAGGIRFHEQIYTIRSAQLNSSLLGISAMVIVIPAAFRAAVNELGLTPATASEGDILKLSRGVAFILLFVYASYLFFQLWTHSYLYSAKAVIHKRSTLHRVRTLEDDVEPQPPLDTSVLRIPSWHSHSSSSDSDSSSNSGSSSSSSNSSDSDDDDSETPKLKVQAGIVLIIIVTVLTGLVAEWLVDSIDGLTETGNVSKEFVALILLPLVGNAAEHVTAVTVSVKDKLDLSLAVAVGSSIQISLFVLPFLILLGWCIGQPLTLQFDVLETITLFVSIVIVNQAISDGKTNWLEGLVLMTVYLIIAVTFFFYPGATESF